jgi:hypothetical protein
MHRPRPRHTHWGYRTHAKRTVCTHEWGATHGSRRGHARPGIEAWRAPIRCWGGLLDVDGRERGRPASVTRVLYTPEAIRKAADHIWPLDTLSTDDALDELIRDTDSGLRAFLAAQDRDALAVAVQKDLGEDAEGYPVCDYETIRAVIDALLDGPDA